MMAFQFSISTIRLLLAMLSFYAGMILSLGSLIFFGVGTASVIFQVLPTTDWAGTVNATILQRLTLVQLVGEAFIIFGLLLSVGSPRRLWRKLPLWLAIGMVLLTLIDGVFLLSLMNDLRAAITSFDHPTSQDQPLIEQFHTYHSLYTTLAGLNGAIALILFLWKTIEFSTLRSQSIITPRSEEIPVSQSTVPMEQQQAEHKSGEQANNGT